MDKKTYDKYKPIKIEELEKDIQFCEEKEKERERDPSGNLEKMKILRAELYQYCWTIDGVPFVEWKKNQKKK